MINKAMADRTCVASGDISSGEQGDFVSANPPARVIASIQRSRMIRTHAGRHCEDLTVRVYGVIFDPRESRPRRGRSDMVNKSALAVVSVLLSSLTAAHAADPGFCRQYAKAALNQVRGGLTNPACAGGLQGARWSTDFAVHYEWCLGASFGAAGTERDARTQYLKGCAGR
jgi:hypothetical protein